MDAAFASEPDVSSAPLQEQTLKQAPSSTGKEQLHTGEAEKDIVPSTLSRWKTVIDQASGKLPVGLPVSEEPGFLLRQKVQSDMAASDVERGTLKVSAAELNKQYPGLPTPFNEAMYPDLAETIYSDHLRNKKLEEWSQRGGGSPFGSQFAAGVAGGFLDPVNLALGFTAGAGAAAMGLKSSVTSVFLQNLSVNAMTGYAGYKQAKAEHQDVSPFGAAQEAVEGAVGGTLFHYGAAVLARALKSGVDLVRRTSVKTQESNLKTAIAQHENGANVDLAEQARETASRITGETRGVQNLYQFAPLSHPSETPHFAAQDHQGNLIESHPFGPGLYGDADAFRANNAASNPGGEPGMLSEIEISKDHKFLDLEQMASSEESKSILSQVEEKLGIKLPEMGETITLKDLLTELHDQVSQGHMNPEVLTDVQDIAKSQGFDGYKFINDTISEKPSNGVMMFDPHHPVSDAQIANPEVTPVLSEAERQAHFDETTGQANSRNASNALDGEIRTFVDNKPLNSTPDYMDPHVKEANDTAMGQLKELAKDDPSLAKELEHLEEQKIIARKDQSLLKTFADCVVKEMV